MENIFNMEVDSSVDDSEFDLGLMCGELLIEPFPVITSHSYMNSSDILTAWDSVNVGSHSTSDAVVANNSNSNIETMTSDGSDNTDTSETKHQKAIRKPHSVKVVWSHKNNKRGKSYREYIERQILIARKFCKHFISVLNTHRLGNFSEFAAANFASNFMYREFTEGIHPFTGTKGVDRKIDGIQNYVQFMTAYFAGVPDGAAIVKRIDILEEGKTVQMSVTMVGTPFQDIKFPGKKRSNENAVLKTFGIDATIKFLLDKENKMLKIELLF